MRSILSAVVAAAVLVGCSDSLTAPEQKEKTTTIVMRNAIFYDSLYIYHHDTLWGKWYFSDETDSIEKRVTITVPDTTELRMTLYYDAIGQDAYVERIVPVVKDSVYYLEIRKPK